MEIYFFSDKEKRSLKLLLPSLRAFDSEWNTVFQNSCGKFWVQPSFLQTEEQERSILRGAILTPQGC